MDARPDATSTASATAHPVSAGSTDAAFAAASCLVGGVAAIVITKPSLASNEVILWWLIYTASAGSLINYRDGLSRRHLLLNSIGSPLVLLGVLLHKALLNRMGLQNLASSDLVLTGVPVSSAQYLVLAGVTYLESVAAIYVFGRARQVLTTILLKVFHADPEKLRQLRRTVTLIGGLGGAVAILVRSIAS